MAGMPRTKWGAREDDPVQATAQQPESLHQPHPLAPSQLLAHGAVREQLIQTIASGLGSTECKWVEIFSPLLVSDYSLQRHCSQERQHETLKRFRPKRNRISAAHSGLPRFI